MLNSRSTESKDRLVSAALFKLPLQEKRKLLLTHAQTVCCTITAAGNRDVLTPLRDRVDRVFVDEAAHCVESDLLILLHYKPEAMTLAGDPHQLGPVVVSKLAEKYGYKLPLMERLRHAGYPIKKLEMTYRLPKQICDWVSNTFYYGELKSDVSVQARLNKLFEDQAPETTVPPMLEKGQHMKMFALSDGQEAFINTSASNEVEAEFVVYCVSQIRGMNNKKLAGLTVAIITYYEAQVRGSGFYDTL